MPIAAERLRSAIDARARLERATREAVEARANLHDAIVAIHESGASLREIADALGLSHQRIHQIVDGDQPGGWSRMIRRRHRHPRPVAHCTFCGRSQAEVTKIVAGPGVYICNHCIELAGRTIDSSAPATDGRVSLDMVQPTDTARCSFCGKRRSNVESMASLVDVRICRECVYLCREVLSEDARA